MTCLRNPPIVEAVVDIDCDMPAGFDLAHLEAVVRKRFADRYPQGRSQVLQEHRIDLKPDTEPAVSARQTLGALRMFQEDGRQLIQVRAQGFSFNRLAPYASFDAYLPEVEWAWRLYLDLAAPAQIRVCRLRYINRILLPMDGGTIDLERYLAVAPRSPLGDDLLLGSFLWQQSAVARETGHQVGLVLTAEPASGTALPVILDITVEDPKPTDPTDWQQVRRSLSSLRAFKNRIFWSALKPECITLLQS